MLDWAPFSHWRPLHQLCNEMKWSCIVKHVLNDFIVRNYIYSVLDVKDLHNSIIISPFIHTLMSSDIVNSGDI